MFSPTTPWPILFTVNLSLFITSCAHPQPAPKAAPPAKAQTCPSTQVFGSYAQMAGGDLSGKVALSTLPWTADTLALGATENKTLEITATRDGLTLVGPSADGGITVLDHPGDIHATFLVYATDIKWGPQQDILGTDIEAILNAVEAQAPSSACADAEIIPFRVQGRAQEVTWTTVGQPIGLHQVDRDIPVEIVGFWAPSQRGIFIPKNRRGHVHIALPTLQRSGHLRALDLEAGAQIQIPQ